MIIFAPNLFQLPLLSDTQNDDITNEQVKLHLTSFKWEVTSNIVKN